MSRPGAPVPARAAALVLALATCLGPLAAPAAASERAAGPPAPRAASTGHPGVEDAQRRLDELGCSAGPADGRVGPWTRSAVFRFQSRTGHAQTGRLDRRTRHRLQAARAPRCDRRPVPPHSGAGRRVVVSQAQNWVWLVGPRGRVLAQGGMVDNPAELAKGVHHTGSYCGRAARIRRNTTTSGQVWLQNFVRFAPCGIGFHRIPTSRATGSQIHADFLLGTDLARSHGCLRLSRQMSLRVWRFTAPGATVRVV